MVTGSDREIPGCLSLTYSFWNGVLVTEHHSLPFKVNMLKSWDFLKTELLLKKLILSIIDLCFDRSRTCP